MANKAFFIGLGILLIIAAVVLVQNSALKFVFEPTSNTSQTVSPQLPSPQPTADERFRTYTAPNLSQKAEYTIVMLGDSMTHALGPHGGEFYEKINAKYKPHNKGILIDNYASGSTSILTVNKAMTAKTTYWDSTFEPMLSRQFDLLLIESFGYNPLSELPREEGLKKQTELLDETMKTVIKTHPESRVVFVATIAPNKEKYALPVNPATTAEERIKQVEEREAFIKNHIEYAKAHNIPVINIFEKSRTPSGDGNLEYINPFDYIHPSAVGVKFIGEELANYIYDNQIIPH